MRTPVGEKIRTLAGLSTTMQTDFGVAPFRWSKKPLPLGYMPKVRGNLAPGGGTSSLEYKLISAVSPYIQTGPLGLEYVRMQFDIMDLDPELVERVAFDVEAFLGTVNCFSGQQFGSPVVTPNQFPTYLSNRREFEIVQTGVLVYGFSIDCQLYNSTLN